MRSRSSNKLCSARCGLLVFARKPHAAPPRLPKTWRRNSGVVGDHIINIGGPSDQVQAILAGRDLCHVDLAHQRILAGEQQPQQGSAAVSVAGSAGNAHPLMPLGGRLTLDTRCPAQLLRSVAGQRQRHGLQCEREDAWVEMNVNSVWAAGPASGHRSRMRPQVMRVDVNGS